MSLASERPKTSLEAALDRLDEANNSVLGIATLTDVLNLSALKAEAEGDATHHTSTPYGVKAAQVK